MSNPVSLHSVFRACRPHNVSIRLRSQPALYRTYADKTKSEFKGIPKTSSKEEQKRVLDQLPEEAPPKRRSPPSTTASSLSAATTNITPSQTAPVPAENSSSTEQKRSVKIIPANVVAAYRAPLKHPAPYGVPVASLQLRSFSVRSLEFFADFALRAAYYLNLPASGPVPLPKKIERWTTLRSNFVNKKAQENFERITYKRLISVMDGEKSAVEVWLAILRKWQFYGVGMKANVWEWEGIDVASKMDAQSKDLQKDVEAKLANFGWNKSVAGSRSLDEMLVKQGVKHAGVPMMEIREGSRRAKPEI